MNFIPELKQKINQLDTYVISKPKEFEGCSQLEIDSLMQAQSVTFLPETYRHFMSEMGKYAKELFTRDSAYTCKYSGENKDVAIEILTENNSSLQLPSDAFVFITYEVVGFAYFHTRPENDNPPVYSYFRGGLEFKLEANSFTDFLFASVQRRAEHLSRAAEAEASQRFHRTLRQKRHDDE